MEKFIRNWPFPQKITKILKHQNQKNKISFHGHFLRFKNVYFIYFYFIYVLFMKKDIEICITKKAL